MLDRENASVLSYARLSADGKAILVSLNMSASPQTVALGLKAAGVAGSALTPLMASPQPAAIRAAADRVTLPPYAAWVASVQ
jgi:hypothetical protein